MSAVLGDQTFAIRSDRFEYRLVGIGLNLAEEGAIRRIADFDHSTPGIGQHPPSVVFGDELRVPGGIRPPQWPGPFAVRARAPTLGLANRRRRVGQRATRGDHTQDARLFRLHLAELRRPDGVDTRTAPDEFRDVPLGDLSVDDRLEECEAKPRRDRQAGADRNPAHRVN